nr:hypothetical protein [Pseudofrankia asymbiotica]
MVLAPQVVDAVARLAVLAAGGIAEGHQVAAALALGRPKCGAVRCGSAPRRGRVPRKRDGCSSELPPRRRW